jgi:hypothetical protein
MELVWHWLLQVTVIVHPNLHWVYKAAKQQQQL